jgi:hypothetical protein
MLGMVVHTCNPSTWEAEARGLRDPVSLKEGREAGREGGKEGGRNEGLTPILFKFF